MILRLSKIALVAAVAFILSLICFNNLTDYDSNYNFVLHVLSMDTTFPGNKLMYRSITSPAVHQIFYGSIIFWEGSTAVVLWVAVARLLQTVKGTAKDFAAKKSLAAIGLVISLLLWFVAFITVGGEWFVMWQSKIWNGQEAAFRMFACLGIILLYLMQPEPE